MNVDKTFLKKIPFFASVDEKALSTLEIETVQFDNGEMILKEGDIADAFYIIIEGDVRIFTFDAKGNQIVLSRLAKGEYFGESAFSSSNYPRRTASVIALKKTTLYRIPKSSLHFFSDEKLVASHFDRYIKDKMQKSFKTKKDLFNETKKLEKREVLYVSGNPVDHFYILLSGEIELRKYGKDGLIEAHIELGLGEIFGFEEIEYSHTAVAKAPSEVIVIPILEFKEMGLQHMRGEFSEKKYQFTQYGKAIQFQGQYRDFPCFSTLIFLGDGREILCNQVMNSQIVSLETRGVTPKKTLQFTNGSNTRILYLVDNILVGLDESGLWEDTHQFLKAIVEKKILSETELKSGCLNLVEVEKDLVCTCMRVKRGEIESAIKGGCCNFEMVQKKTKASTVCGACRPTILEMLGQNSWMACRVSLLESHTHEIKTFRISPLDVKKINFLPGQHVIVRADIDNLPIRRSYTLTSRDGDPHFEVTIKREEFGIFSRWIYEKAEEMPLIYASGPFGDFVLNDKKTAVICFAGGIGITPFVAFARALDKSDRKLVIDYSARTRQDFAFRKELESFSCEVHFRDTSQGMITEKDILELVNRFENPDVYICGPSTFEDFLVDTLKKNSFPDNSIHVEQFLQAGAPDTAPQMVTF